jgi:outer membrane protein OmpA-like peptidoglycan-associated protein
MTLSSSIKSGIYAAAVSVLVASSAFAQSTNDAVYDKNNTHVLDTRGNCVRSANQLNENDVCGAKTEVAAKARGVSELNKEELVVYFDFDKSVVKASEKEKLNRLAAILKAAKEVSGAKVIGYADPIGTPKYNVALSERRAAAVEAYLNSQGYKNTELASVQGLGETNAYARCEGVKKRTSLIKCFWPNRRVEVSLEYKK